MSEQLDPSRVTPEKIMEVGMAFWPSKILLSAVELELFTKLGDRKLTAEELAGDLGVCERARYDFFDALVATGFLLREGDGAAGLYANTPETGTFLDKNKPTYIGGILEMSNSRLYRFWADLTEALRTGKPQNEVKTTGAPMFDELYADEARLEQFMGAMSGISTPNFAAFAQAFDFSKYKTLCDVGGASGILSILVAQAHPHMKCTSFDLPVVEPIAKRRIAGAGLGGRVSTASGDFFKDGLPKADVVTMGLILHDWNLENKMHLIRAAYDALPEGGAFVVIENLIDDARRENAFGLFMSLNMLIEFGDAFDYSGADFTGWCKDVGFSRTEVVPLGGPCSMGIAYK